MIANSQNSRKSKRRIQNKVIDYKDHIFLINCFYITATSEIFRKTPFTKTSKIKKKPNM